MFLGVCYKVLLSFMVAFGVIVYLGRFVFMFQEHGKFIFNFMVFTLFIPIPVFFLEFFNFSQPFLSVPFECFVVTGVARRFIIYICPLILTIRLPVKILKTLRFTRGRARMIPNPTA